VTVFLARPERSGEGIPLAVKDLFDTAGLRTTYGSILFADHVPAQTAEAVARLEAAGYANVGKTNLHEFAYGISSYNPYFGHVSNPLDPTRTAGGSSAGSGAALAAGLADAALGSDSGGSIRIPAACCGIVGFKPSYGLVSLEGCRPLAPSFDHAGPMGRDVDACAQMLAALAPSLELAELGSLDDVEVGVAWLDHAEPLVRARVAAAAELRIAARSSSPSPRKSGPSSCARWPNPTAGSSPSTPTPTARTCGQSSKPASR
jgi:aspartyl-tRNA(Asn)/glutamyl-tRNA(Gln) amidotransferase subunit A